MKERMTRARLRARVVHRATGCWIWPTARSGNYGFTSYKGERIGTHRLAWLLFRGDIPPGLCVLHKCDVRECVNPRHLFIGTKTDNNFDRDRKGRTARPIGELNGYAKLTNKQVRAIRADSRYQHVIANDYGVSQTLISQIKLRKIWTHI